MTLEEVGGGIGYFLLESAFSSFSIGSPSLVTQLQTSTVQVVAEIDYETPTKKGAARIFGQSRRLTHPIRTVKPATAAFCQPGIFLISGSDNNDFINGYVPTIDKYLKDFSLLTSRLTDGENCDDDEVHVIAIC